MRAYFRQLASESLVYGLSSVLSKLVFVLLVPLYTRLFTPAEYGVMTLAGTATSLATVLVALALDNSAHRWFWDTEDDEDRRRTIASWAWCQLLVAAVTAVALTAGAGWVARVLLGVAEAAPYVRIAAWTLPLSTLGLVATNWLRMQRRPWATLLFNLGMVTGTIGLTLLFVVGFRWGLAGVFWAQVAAAGITTVVGAATLRGWVDPRRFRLDRLREMLRFALPVIPGAVSYWVVSAVDRVFVERYVSTADVGIYQVGFAVASVVAVVTQAFQQAWGPFALSIHKRPDAREFYARALLAYLWVACFVSAGVGVLSREVLALFTTASYAGGEYVAAILAFSFVLSGLAYIANIGAGLAREMRPIGLATTAAALLNVALNFLLTPRIGKEGAATATLLSQAVVPAYLFHRSQQLYPIPYRFRAAAVILLASGAVTAVGMRVRTGHLLVDVVVKLLLVLALVPLLFRLRVVGPGLLLALRRRGAAVGVPSAPSGR